MAFWAAAAPGLISAGASLLSGLMSKKPKTDPAVKARMNLENALLRKKQGYLNQLDQYLGRGTLMGSDGKPLTLRLGEGWPKSLGEFMQAADFGGKRDLDNLMKFIELANPGSNTSGAVQSGAAASANAAERNASSIASALNKFGQAAWDEYGVGGKDGVAKDLAQIVSKAEFDTMPIDGGNLLLDLTKKASG